MGLGHARTYLKGYLMAIEKTFIMIKPDAVRDRKIGEIVARIERSGLVIERMEMTTLERATVEEHYAHLAALLWRSVRLYDERSGRQDGRFRSLRCLQDAHTHGRYQPA